MGFARTAIAAAALLLVGASFAPAQGQSVSDRLSLHGFLTQAYGDATDAPLFGIPEDGTADLRSAALQARFSFTRDAQAVVQVSHRRLGQSLMADMENTVELDWLYYAHRFGGAQVRAGRIPMPRGLFNETREVGVILPFYRASKAFYSEGVRTVDGALIGYQRPLGDWGIETSAFYGSFEIRTQFVDATGLAVTRSDWEHALGGQLIVNTPVPGLRAGATLQRAEAKASDATNRIWTASVDGTFDRSFARAEYQLYHQPQAIDYEAYYLQGGFNVVGGLWVNTQLEWNNNTYLMPGMNGHQVAAIRDYALGLSYRWSPQLVLKVEGHDFKGYELDRPVNPMGPAEGTRYFIFSVSTAF
jgi:hypothetical protein